MKATTFFLFTFFFSSLSFSANYEGKEPIINIIKGVDLSVTATQAVITLDWSTYSEFNTTYFEVEKTTDGDYWTKTGQVKASYNSSIKNHYHYTDSLPLEGYSYYRVLLYDINGNVFSSEAVSVFFEAVVQSEIAVYPNPSAGALQISASSSYPEISKVTVYNPQGIAVAGHDRPNKNGVFFMLSDQTEGIFLIEISHAEGTELLKWVKQG